jgi:hypothetical protein
MLDHFENDRRIALEIAAARPLRDSHLVPPPVRRRSTPTDPTPAGSGEAAPER